MPPLQKIAPSLYQALQGPLASAALGMIRVDPQHAEDDAQVRDQASLLRLYEGGTISAGDLRNAERRWKALLAAHGGKGLHRKPASLIPRAPLILAVVIVGGYFFVLTLMFTLDIPTAQLGGFSILLGALSTMTGAVVNYYFGSSLGSKEKERALMAYESLGSQAYPSR